jgi:hypothetical protein
MTNVLTLNTECGQSLLRRFDLMPVLHATDKILMTFKGTLIGQTILNTFPLTVISVTGTPEVNDCLDALEAKIAGAGDLKTAYLNAVADNYTLDEIWLQVIFATRYRKKVYTIAAGGNSGANSLTPNVAGVLTRAGDQANKHNIGAIHLPIGTDDTSIVNGKLQATQKGLLNTVGTKCRGTVSTSSPAVTYAYSLFQHDPAGLPSFVTTTFAQETARVMRRRTVGLGI